MAPSAPDFRALFEAAPGHYLVVTPTLEIVAASDAYLELTATVRDAVVGRHVLDVLPDDAAALRASLAHVLQHRVAGVMPVRRVAVSGPGGKIAERCFRPANSPVFGADGAVAYLIHRLDDVTELVDHRTLAPDVPPRPAAAAEPATDPPLVLVVEDHAEMNRFIGVVLSGEYRVAAAFDGREGLEQAHALRPDLIVSDVMMPQLTGDDMLRAIRSDPSLDHVPILMLTAKTDDALRIALLRAGAQDYLLKPFSPEELRARARNLIAMKRARDVLEGELAGRGRDLADMARELARRKRALETTCDALAVARDQAERATKAKSMFLNLVSHELRQPLTALQIYLHVLAREGAEAFEPRHQHMVRTMVVSAKRVFGLVDALLEQARILGGRLETRTELVDLVALAQEALADAEEQANGKALAFSVDAAPDLPPLWSDARLVRVILINLVGNAVKFTEQGAIEVSLRYERGEHRIVVADSGAGIPPERQLAVFEPFAHLEPIDHKHTPGIGLGLTLVKEMAEALGGRIELRSEVGIGSEFAVVLRGAEGPAARASA